MAFEDLLRDIWGRSGPVPGSALKDRRGKETSGQPFYISSRGNMAEEGNHALRIPLKNYFMHELPDQIGRPGVWREEFEVVIETLLDCNSFYIEPAKPPRYSWKSEKYLQCLGFSAISPVRLETYLVELSGDRFILDTDLYEPVEDKIRFGEFVEIYGRVLPTVRLFAGEYFFNTSQERFSLDPTVLVFSLPPSVRPLAALALERDRRKHLYSAAISRNHLNGQTQDVRLRHLVESLNRAIPSMESIIEVARSYGETKIKPLITAYNDLCKRYLTVWVKPAKIITVEAAVKNPKIIGSW